MPRNGGGYGYAQPVNTYSGLPVEEVKALNQAQSEQYNTNRAAKDALDVLYNNLDIEDRNYEIKRKAIDGVKTKFKDLVSQGNYQDAKYVISDAVKAFQTDNELQGALKSRQKEKAYYEDLRNRLESGTQSTTSTESTGKDKLNKETTKRSGGINRDIYQYAIAKSKEKNKGQIKYNPETGLTEGGFEGVNVVDDKSGDIYDELYKRTQDWKAETIEANGTTYKMDPTKPRGYLNVQTGETVDRDEVQKALVTELSNRGDWKDFLSQEREIDRYKKFGSSQVTSDAFNQLGMTEDSLKNHLLGIDDKKLEQLSKSKSAEDKKEWLRIEEEKALMDLNNVDQNQLTSLYDSIQRKQQLHRYTSSAADKAGYTKYKDEFLKDEAYLMALDFGYKKKLKELEHKMDTPMYPASNYSIAKTLDANSFAKVSADHESTLKQIKDIETKYGPNVNNIPPDVRHKYNDLKADLKIYEQNAARVYDDIDKKGGNVYEKVKEKIFNPSSGDYAATMDFLLNTPGLANLPAVQALVNAEHKHVERMSSGSPVFSGLGASREHAYRMASNLQKIMDDIKIAKYDKDPRILNAIENYTHKVGISNDQNSSVKDIIEKTKAKYFENNEANLYQINTKVLADDDDNPKSPVHVLTSKYADLAKSGSDFKTVEDKSIPELIEEYNSKIKEKDKKIELKDVKVNITTQPVLGKYAINVTLPNGKSELLYPNDQEDYKRNLYMLSNYLTNSGNPEAVIQGQDIASHINFGDLRNELSNLASKEKGGVIPIDLPIDFNTGKVNTLNGRNQKFTLVVVDKNSDGTPIYSLADRNGNTQIGDVAFGQMNINNKFANISKLINALQTINVAK